jgi:hypothetical protein
LPAWLKVTTQVPVPAVMVTVPALSEHGPVTPMATVPPGAVAATLNDALNAALAGAGAVTVMT